MEKLLIRGGKRLFGEVEVGGFKNAALPILYAAILCADVSLIENVPRIRDVLVTLDILEQSGAVARFVDTHTVLLDTRAYRPCRSPDALVSRLRASAYLLGAELSRFGRTRAAIPGGCSIGKRPLDLHMAAFGALGASVAVEEHAVAAVSSGLSGGEIVFPFPSVGATVNAILASCGASGESVIRGTAREPHIVDLCRFLCLCGADIEGAGSDVICVRGGRPLHGTAYRLMPDMIEAGTFLCALSAAGGEVFLHGTDRDHIRTVLDALSGCGVTLSESAEGIAARRTGELAPVCLTAAPYPGFPTDMHPPFAALAAAIPGTSRIRETVFPDRFRYVSELARMGAHMQAKNGEVTIIGAPLHPAVLTAVDLRAGAAEVVAALGTRGCSTIREAAILERGYDSLPEKLIGIGADVCIR